MMAIANRLFVEVLLALAIGGAIYLVVRRWLLPTSGAPPAGFGGALLYVAIVQWLGVVIVAARLLWRMPPWEDYVEAPQVHASSIAEAIGHLAALVFVLWAALSMTRRRRLFPVLLRIELALLAVLPVVELFFATGRDRQLCHGAQAVDRHRAAHRRDRPVRGGAVRLFAALRACAQHLRQVGGHPVRANSGASASGAVQAL